MPIAFTRSTRALALLALVALGACSIDAPTDPTGSSLFARKPRPVPGITHDPILFVHGWNASSTTWTTMVSRFKTDGWTSAELVNWSYNYRQSNATTAAQISAKVDSILLATGATHVDIITHSMGTLSARYYVRNLGGDGKVDALVSLGGANHGTNTAFFCGDTSCGEMRPNSSFLTALNSTDETWGTPRYATWWTSCDQVIQPATSTILSGATNTQTACMQHSDLHEDATVYSQVKSWVSPAQP
jgi:triacylglycerol lipase